MHEYCKLTSPANARVREQDQLHLFKLTVADLLKQWRVSIDVLDSLFSLELLSFEPVPDLALEPPQEAELTFLLSLRRAGWGDEQLLRGLSSLSKPYCYDVQRLVYDAHARRWFTRTSVDDRELTIEGRISRAREDQDVRTLKEIAQEAMKALVALTEEALSREGDPRI